MDEPDYKLDEVLYDIVQLRDALQLCVDVLDSDEMQAVWTFLHVHGYTYHGPKINMNKIRALLKDTEA